MKKNIGVADKSMRILAAVVFGVLILTDMVSGGLAWLLGILGVVFLLTSVVGFCPLYSPFKISTCKEAVSPAK